MTTYQYQDNLPKLPIPPLEDTLQRYLSAVKPLQREKDFLQTNTVVGQFLENEGPKLQEKLQSYATDKSSYIEEFWYDSYLSYTDPVVLNLNPFFVLADDPTPARNNQVSRAASLILSSLNFVHALRTETLEPDVFRGTPLDMSQFQRMFGTARLPTEKGCKMDTDPDSKHIVVLCRGQFYWFDVLNENNEVGITEKELVANLKTIKQDAEGIPVVEIAKHAVGILSTENRRIWADLRDMLEKSSENKDFLKVLDSALFVVCLDEVSPKTGDELATNMLCGTYDVQEGVQVGTCANRWYDKLQIIVCENGSAGVNFEHTGVDGHTVLRFVSDIYTDTIFRFASTIKSHKKSLFHSIPGHSNGTKQTNGFSTVDTLPKKLEWILTPEVRTGIRFAETRLSDLILQNEVQVLEYEKYGKSFITGCNLSPDAFVQIAFQAAYYGLYGSIESTYEPAMTKAFSHGRTEAIRSVTTDSVDFVKLWWADVPDSEKLKSLRKAIKTHADLTKMCSKGLGQDRHLYALLCVWQREFGKNPDNEEKMPAIFRDSGWQTLNHTVLSTSNCGNPALRFFGFGPVVSNGFGLGYIIKDEGITFCASSKHRQTRRFLQTLENYLNDVHLLLRSERQSSGNVNARNEEYISMLSGYGYFDAGGIDQLLEYRFEEKKEDMKRIGTALKLVDF
ncbi:acyltransferase ChoActase/COT/CPT [Gigaspora margarita]|uniref:Acyltransferase ChoActase/COT/CPT n=1 Tax=Gigaspora margarita TaxID=4874 RepID=A0A8H4A6P5_GIGMA|nr:acyltransferase ChoActase/COT/CPT [Gigaspora margarita]